MFAGHVGAALAIGRAERRVNVGMWVTAAVLLDALLWIFVLLGLESVTIPANFVSTHQAQFIFPYSHGLAASLVWSLLAAAVGFACYRRLPQVRRRAALLVAAAVFSHWLLDGLVHRPELPVTGAASHAVGLGLWDRMPLALTLEAAILVAGLMLFLSGARLARSRSITLVVASLVILAFTVVGMTLAPPPPSVLAMAGTSLGTLAVVCGLMYWLGASPPQPKSHL